MRRWLIAVPIVVVATIAATWSETGQPVTRKGTVVRAVGGPSVRRHAECVLSVTPESRGGCNCRVTLECAGQTLYGGEKLGGYARCDVRDDEYVTAVDDMLASKDGDPWIGVDLAAGQAIFRDHRPPTEIVVALAR